MNLQLPAEPERASAGEHLGNESGAWAPTGRPSNWSGGGWSEGAVDEDVRMVVIQFVYALVCLVGLAGNAMVIFVILRYAKMKTATNIYLLNLALADELFMLSVPFVAAAAALDRWPFGPLMCRAVLSVDGLNQFTSVFGLTVLSADRYVAVVHPIKAARYRRPSVARLVNLGVWLLSLLVILPIVVFAGTAPVMCAFLWPQPAWSVAFVVYTFLLGFLLPVLAISLCYLLIILQTRAVALKAGWHQRRRSERKLTRLVLTVVAVFVVCWLPFYAVHLAGVFLAQRNTTVNHLCVILSYANSCANPILYGFLSDNFRRSFQRILCFRWLENDTEEPVDYCSTALKSKVGSPLEFQPAEDIASESVYRNGTCTSRTTTL
ncbi:hypothetical protein chiPu_2000037 [Chiloscyllium punctatum]|uniref:G-protein coupled receptors family 1 profile domain-containing protein n=1 Tax=Chiloscyllium punctatum TaxID=137246 RepID=A0A401S601_CHIPU|nr:hypothetical protein [Chiloscyllium punctatum]